ncbi:2-C-methyl-D-erythritol 4-phosphate cytidylyltransferase [Mitsuokella sp. WILCCON 0060]|uniref:2-C-methyl-D-erythritol 4-phosphate cytidylyltransferase n=1 Tax=Mitsuokella sp. WILCCON 0060 TaxID=3345341 RepID=UPI003F1B1AD1
MNTAVIFAGGTGKRMNTKSLPKQFLEVHGKPVIIYTLEEFERHPEIDQIILVCLESWIDYAKKLLLKFQIAKVVSVVPGGATGQESIFHGLDAAYHHMGDEKDIVLIHDGVRPMIDQETIGQCLACVREHGNAITTTPAIETIFVNGEAGRVGEIFNRSQCAMARAPQCFYLEDIYAAHLKAQAEHRGDFIDSAMLMQHYGAKLYMVDGPVENIKITTPTDFYLFRALLDAKENLQIVGF